MLKIVLVCGGRDYNNYPALFAKLDTLKGIAGIVHGGASGADALAGQYADVRQIPCTTIKADWDRHGKAAGPIRNEQMLQFLLQYQSMYEILVVVAPGGRGTADMTRRALAAGVRIERVTDADITGNTSEAR